MKNSKLPPSVQFHDNLETIESMLERRFSVRRIWQSLQDEDKYTGNYPHFNRLVKKEFGDRRAPFKKMEKTTKTGRPRTKEEPITTPKEYTQLENDDENGIFWAMDTLDTKKHR